MPFAQVFPAGGNACDFCASTLIHKTYRVRNFELKHIPVFGSDEGTWSTCKNCGELVDAEKWSALTERSFQKFMSRHGVPRHSAPSIRARFEEMVKRFSEHLLL
jgi:hypothetical protein